MFYSVNAENLIFKIVYIDSQPLQWKVRKTLGSSASKVLDVQFGISSSRFKMVSF